MHRQELPYTLHNIYYLRCRHKVSAHVDFLAPNQTSSLKDSNQLEQTTKDPVPGQSRVSSTLRNTEDGHTVPRFGPYADIPLLKLAALQTDSSLVKVYSAQGEFGPSCARRRTLCGVFVFVSGPCTPRLLSHVTLNGWVRIAPL